MKNRQGQFLTWTRPENKVYDGNDGLITNRKRISLSDYLIIELNSRTDTSSKKFYSIRSQTKAFCVPGITLFVEASLL